MNNSFNSIDDFFSQIIDKIDGLSESLDFIKSRVDKGLKPEMLYTPKEVAAILKCCERTVYDYLNKGILKNTKIGKKFYISTETLNEFIEKGTTGFKNQE
jgi:excisionase family DNA binding protein